MQITIHALNSSAIETIELTRDSADVTFTGGRTYTYRIANMSAGQVADMFQTTESVGSEFNRLVKEQVLVHSPGAN